MTAEYSYFRAEKYSSDAVKMTIKARDMIKMATEKLVAFYGAAAFYFTPRTDARQDNYLFIFDSSDTVPAGLMITSIQTDSSGQEQAVLASFKPGTEAELITAPLLEIITTMTPRTQLENAFSCGEMPKKSLPAGRYSGAFVRQRTCIGDFQSAGSKQPDEGYIQDGQTFCFGSNQPVNSSDPLVSVQLAGDWYIRVPNDPAGNPVFTPPDGVLMDYADILEIDRRENDLRYGYKPPAPPIAKPPRP